MNFENVLTLRGAKEGTCLSIICKKLILYVQAVDYGVVLMTNGRGEYRLVLGLAETGTDGR